MNRFILAAVLVAACENQPKSPDLRPPPDEWVKAEASRAVVTTPPTATPSRDRNIGPMGTAHPFVVQASSYANGWIVACQARADSDNDGEIAVDFGHHGEAMGDDLTPYLFLDDGPGEEIEMLVATHPTDRFIVYLIGGHLRLLDAAAGTHFDLSSLGDIDAKSFRFGPGDRMAMVKRGLSSNQVLLLNVESAEGRAVYDFAGPIAAGEFGDDGKDLTIYEVPKDSDGDGERRIPVANTTRAQGACIGPAYSWGHYGYTGDELVPRTLDIPAPPALHARDPDAPICLKYASRGSGPVHWDPHAEGCQSAP